MRPFGGAQFRSCSLSLLSSVWPFGPLVFGEGLFVSAFWLLVSAFGRLGFWP